MVAKSFPRKQVHNKNFHVKFLVEIFLCLQNHFLENRFTPKIFMNVFWSKTFYGCKIISSKTGSNQKLSMKYFWSKIYCCKLISSRTGSHQIFSSKFLWSKIFCLQNNFLENRFEPKIFVKHLWSKMFVGCKIISSKTCLNNKF